jgi:hypothetical protein
VFQPLLAQLSAALLSPLSGIVDSLVGSIAVYETKNKESIKEVKWKVHIGSDALAVHWMNAKLKADAEQSKETEGNANPNASASHAQDAALTAQQQQQQQLQQQYQQQQQQAALAAGLAVQPNVANGEQAIFAALSSSVSPTPLDNAAHAYANASAAVASATGVEAGRGGSVNAIVASVEQGHLPQNDVGLQAAMYGLANHASPMFS